MTHCAYLCHQPLSDAARFFFHCETCDKSSPKFVQKADARAALAAHLADTLVPEVEAHQGLSVGSGRP